jgi:hypothetical protein
VWADAGRLKEGRSVVEQSDDIERLATALKDRTNQPVDDRFYFLLRVGSNWRDYAFSWEPFNDLAGPLSPQADGPSTDALPIAVISIPSASGPTAEVSEDPFPHVEITVAPAVPVQQIVESWIAELRNQGVESAAQPAPWFLEGLELQAGDVSDDVRSFLGLSEPAAASQATSPAPDAPSLSETLQSIAEELPSTEITAFDIARAIAGRHPEYASGRLRGMTLDAPVNTVSHEWELWRDSIARLFDRAALARSRHKVIDGRLFLAGLGLIDKPLRDALGKRGDWAPLLLEVDEVVAPTGSQLRSFLQAVQFAHGYQSDQASGQDQLDIQGEVNAVCEVITDPEVKRPSAPSAAPKPAPGRRRRNARRAAAPLLG